MATSMLKCPSCSGSLTFDPAHNKLVCQYCGSTFSEEEISAGSHDFSSFSQQSDDTEDAQAQSGSCVYTCQNCGAVISADATTAATECVYCHSPLLLTGRLSRDFTPDFLLPFTITREEAADKFISWTKKKLFIPKTFFSRSRIDKLTGVYYPYWAADISGSVSFEGSGKIVRSYSAGNYICTDTDHYEIARYGNISFKNVMRSALNKADHKLTDAIMPYDMENLVKFSAPYLSGFVAEQRDIDRSEIAEGVESELRSYAKTLITNNCRTKYSHVIGNSKTQFDNKNYKYVLLPAWILTYYGDDKKMYYFAMNGRTGEICGKLPISKGRLAVFGLLLYFILAAFLLIVGYVL